MNINIEQLEEIYSNYKEYIKRVEKIKGIKIHKNQQIIPLLVELGELLNEFPSIFKYWRQSSVDNKEKGLEEFADCLNFVFAQMDDYDMEYIKEYSSFMDGIKNSTSTIYCNICNLCNNLSSAQNSISQFYELMEIGYKLGFTWKEIYKASKDKNKIINERLEKGY